MHTTHLRSIDLNLLVPLALLLEHASVSRAAAAANMSQPAMSRALGRLRALLNDPLLIRGPQGTTLTPRAEALHLQVKQTLREVHALVEPADFDPATWQGEVTIAASDQQTLQHLPQLMAEVMRAAPGVRLQVVPIGPETRTELEAGRIHLAFAVEEEPRPKTLRFQQLYEDEFVTLLRKNHPALVGWDLTAFLALDHILVTVQRDGPGILDTELSRAGLRRRVRLRLPHFYAAMTVVAQSDMAVTLPRRLADRYAGSVKLAVVPTPVRRAPFTMGMLWPERLHHDPASRWLRECLAKSVAGSS